MTYLFYRGASLPKRGVMIAALFVATSVGNRVWDGYFSHKIQESYDFVLEAGGTPFPVERDLHHMFWHPMWCGLGDFDTKYGYEWNDYIAFKYAKPIMVEEKGLEFPLSRPKKFDDGMVYGYFYDEQDRYYKTLWEFPEIHEILKEKVVHDVTNDPCGMGRLWPRESGVY